MDGDLGSHLAASSRRFYSSARMLTVTVVSIGGSPLGLDNYHHAQLTARHLRDFVGRLAQQRALRAGEVYEEHHAIHAAGYRSSVTYGQESRSIDNDDIKQPLQSLNECNEAP